MPGDFELLNAVDCFAMALRQHPNRGSARLADLAGFGGRHRTGGPAQHITHYTANHQFTLIRQDASDAIVFAGVSDITIAPPCPTTSTTDQIAPVPPCETSAPGKTNVPAWARKTPAPPKRECAR